MLWFIYGVFFVFYGVLELWSLYEKSREEKKFMQRQERAWRVAKYGDPYSEFVLCI